MKPKFKKISIILAALLVFVLLSAFEMPAGVVDAAKCIIGGVLTVGVLVLIAGALGLIP